MLPASDLLPGEFVMSWCGIRESIVRTVLGGVCFVACGRRLGWHCMAVVARCVVEGRMQWGCGGCVWSLRCVDVSSLAFRGWSSSAGGCSCGEGFMAFGFGGMCSISVGGRPVERFMFGFMGGELREILYSYCKYPESISDVYE
ncbi:hypothetical protein XENOCAPTIV_006692 [Xenoophorus captivus]|uniref:Uncharacterized protein n=1 Tax=Xenoophorus captivus TaxID=1517983 RepID=A0ABV0QGV7_9TELE